jgi:parvulin-like peptidyl-prolyl isomerase
MSRLLTIQDSPEKVVTFLKGNVQYKDICSSILHQKIINQTAIAKGIVVAPEEIQAEVDGFRLKNHLEKTSDTLAWLSEQMITPEEWEFGITKRLLAQKLANHLFAKDVERIFAQSRINFDRVLLYQIIVNDEALAQELFYQIEEEEISFYLAAHLYDIDEQRRQKCGYEGEIDRYNIHPDIAPIVFGAEVDKVTYPIKIDRGYHLLMVEKFIHAELTPQRYQMILDKLFEDWLNNEQNYLVYGSAEDIFKAF